LNITSGEHLDARQGTPKVSVFQKTKMYLKLILLF
jgi:hypothetical protein